ncbi:MAG: carboxypeptidase regulatory-like domain-containing protein [Acidobacteria bacterium]|nr:carboxypeptidase regulatory-like domain-containing protein [Acidobacteriota bacterium]
MRKAITRYILLTLLLVLGGAFGAYAQANSELTGIVTDQTGAVVAGATITLTDPGTGSTKTTESGPTGLYQIGGLNPATYNLKVTAKGFQAFAQTGIVVNVSATVRTDIKLTVGAESQTVTVAADALQVQTDSNVVSSLISAEQISEIATENRNFAALAALGLGVSSALPDSNTPTSVASNFTISVNGLRQSHNIWLIDGGEADDRGGAGGMDIMPSQDAIAEFNMLTSNYPPDYGISSGATMSLSLKSGTQKFHGTLFEFNRTPAYDAKEPISGTKTNIHYNIFGGNIGGPVFIPHVYNSNRQKTFFFWNEEWRKILSGAGTTNVPTLPMADRPVSGQDLQYVAPGFASDTTIHVPSGISDPVFLAKLTAAGLTPGGAFPNNTIPHSLFDPNAVIYMNSGIVPKPTTSDDKAVANVSNPIDVRDDVLRIDHKFNDKWAILGHYMHDTVNQGYALPFLGWLWASFNTVTSNLSNPANSAAIKLSGTINPNLLVEASINYDGNVINITNSDLANKSSDWNANPFFNNGSKLYPGMDWGGPYYVAEQQGSAPWHNAAQDYEPKVDVSYTMGKHAMKFGFSYNRYTKNQQLFGPVMGQASFGANKTGDAFMDMLLGLSSNYNQFMDAPIRHYVNQTPSAYAMDNWHVTPRLSLQLGLRYDALPHAWERSNAVSNFDQSLYLSSAQPKWNSDGSMDPTGPGFQTVGGVQYYLNGIGLAGQNGFPRGLVKNDYSTLQPRVGFSEDISGNGKTVLRGGFGTFFERMQGNDIYNAATTPPYAYSPSAGNVYLSSPNTSWVTGDSAALPFFPSGITNLPQTYRAPAVAQFSLGVQREVTPSVILVVQYVGNLAWHQNIQRHINNYPIDTDLTIRCRAGDGSNSYPGDKCPDGSTPTNLANGALYRQFQGWGDINQQENTTNGSYNGFQTGLRVQNRWGLSGEVDYTWSHEIDLTTYDLNGISNPFNPKYDKGSGALDRRHILSINYVYKLPIFRGSSGFAHSILGGWEIAGTVVGETGVIPANQGPGVSMNYDSIGLGGGYTNRPDQNSKTKYLKKRNEWFDTSAFTLPVPAWLGGANQGFGSARKDAIVGPGRVNFTTSLYKSFAMTERAHFELRFESFNTFNHFQPNGLNVSKGASQFGQITSAWDPRVMELGGKFIF